MNKKTKQKKYIISSLFLFGLLFFGLVLPSGASAALFNPENWVLSILGVLLSVFTFVSGAIISLVVWGITHVASYNNFINEPQIINAWIVIRDLCNMFFVLILLLISFATILRYENYNVTRLLPKLILMAVLINFSRTICGLIIDFSQVVMLTFINAIGSSGGNWINTLGVQNFLSSEITNWSSDRQFLSTVGGYILSVVFLVISITVFLVLFAVLVARIVYLWIYVVLSPIAFLCSAFPAGQSYAKRWWDDFINQVTVGPVLAFFMWLSLVAAQGVNSLASDTGDAQCFGPSDIACPAKFMGFVIAIGMLIGGLREAQKAGEATGSFAGKGLGWAKSNASKATGARWAKDRFDAFKGHRESERKAKVAAGGERLFGLYSGIKGAGVGAAKGIDRMAGGAFSKTAATIGTAATGGAPLALYAAKKGMDKLSKIENTRRRKFDASQGGEKEDSIEENGIKHDWNKKYGAYVNKERLDEVLSRQIRSRDIADKRKELIEEVEQMSGLSDAEKSERKEQIQLSSMAGIKSFIEQDRVNEIALKNDEGNLRDKHGRYKDEDGNEHRYDEETKDYYRANRFGQAVNEEGRVLLEDKNGWQKAGVGAKMSENGQRAMSGWMSGRSKAYAIKNKANEEAVSKKQQALADAGVSQDYLRHTLANEAANKDERLAAAMTLAIKAGFKNKDQVNKAKELIGDNGMLMSKFNDGIDKKFAHLNYDLSTEMGKEKFMTRLNNGAIDGTSMTHGAYKDENLIKTLKEFYGSQFGSKMGDVGKNSSRHADNLKLGLTKIVKDEIKNGRKLDENKNINAYGKALAGINGDILTAAGGPDKFDNDSAKGVENLIKGAKIEHIAKIDADLFDKKKVAKKYSIEESKAARLVDELKKAIGNSITVDQIISTNKSGKASKALIDQFVEAIEDAKKGGRNIPDQQFNKLNDLR